MGTKNLFAVDGLEKKLALGAYPDVSLKDARAARDAARKLSQTGGDPAVAKREERIAKRLSSANTFGAIAEEYIAKREAEEKADVTIGKTRWLLPKLTPALGTRPISEITPHELLAMLRVPERAGHRETHADANQVRAAYHRGAYWPERIEMAQWWSDHLDVLKEGASVVSLWRAS